MEVLFRASFRKVHPYKVTEFQSQTSLAHWDRGWAGTWCEKKTCKQSREEGSSAKSHSIKIRWSQEVKAIRYWGHDAYLILLLLIFNVCS